MNIFPDSVSGCFHDFMIVGIPANASLIIAKIIATIGSFVIPQSISAKIEHRPQMKSKGSSFQYDLGFTKELMKIKNGTNPEMKTGSTAQLTPSDKAATTAIIGAIDHINQVTRLGFVLP